MKTQLVDFEGNFGSQDPALQPTAEDFAAISRFIQSRRTENEALLEAYRQQAAAVASLETVQEAGQAV